MNEAVNPFAGTVSKGAALLDEKLPDWAHLIDVDSLVMQSGCECVLGQIGADRVNLDRLAGLPHKSPVHVATDERYFWGACEVLALDDPDAYGFDVADDILYDEDHDDDAEWESQQYDLLRSAWMNEIRSRRTA